MLQAFSFAKDARKRGRSTDMSRTHPEPTLHGGDSASERRNPQKIQNYSIRNTYHQRYPSSRPYHTLYRSILQPFACIEHNTAV